VAALLRPPLAVLPPRLAAPEGLPIPCPIDALPPFAAAMMVLSGPPYVSADWTVLLPRDEADAILLAEANADERPAPRPSGAEADAITAYGVGTDGAGVGQIDEAGALWGGPPRPRDAVVTYAAAMRAAASAEARRKGRAGSSGADGGGEGETQGTPDSGRPRASPDSEDGQLVVGGTGESGGAWRRRNSGHGGSGVRVER